jgi:hypothetical protein
MDDLLAIESDGPVAPRTLDRPDRLDAVSFAMAGALR